MAFIAFWFFSFFLIVSSVFVVMARNPVHSVLYLIFAFFNGAALFLLLGAEFLAMLLVIVYVGAVAVLFLFVVMMLNVTSLHQRHSLSWDKLHSSFRALGSLFIYMLPFSLIFGAGGYYLQTLTPDIQWQLLGAGALFFIARWAAKTFTGINCFEAMRRFLAGVPLPFILGLMIVGEILFLITSTPLPLETSQGKTLTTALLGQVLYTHYALPFFLAGFILLVAMIGAIILTLRHREEGKRQNIQAQIARGRSIELIEVPLGQGLEGGS